MAFTLASFAYICGLILDTFLIFFATLQVSSFDELRTDYKNPIDLCDTLNPLVLPEYGIHLALNILFVMSGQWLSLLLNIPLIGYHIYKYQRRPFMSNQGLYDPTTIMNGGQVSRSFKEGWIKLFFYVISFFFYVCAMIYSLID